MSDTILFRSINQRREDQAAFALWVDGDASEFDQLNFIIGRDYLANELDEFISDVKVKCEIGPIRMSHSNDRDSFFGAQK